ncbi:hypothetical protein [Streptomyces sp. NBC_01244]|uniref:hypothetical protein n=1 Tax=Streptomyces sp. NBC_01244 TaxID=2903797 RepID=UPI002E0D5F06|nr:hypothetical protein OG247_22110 [Streptomyces sp. NBC_01244]
MLRNGAEGPEVWIRAVAADWKPGDGWAGHQARPEAHAQAHGQAHGEARRPAPVGPRFLRPTR